MPADSPPADSPSALAHGTEEANASSPPPTQRYKQTRRKGSLEEWTAHRREVTRAASARLRAKKRAQASSFVEEGTTAVVQGSVEGAAADGAAADIASAPSSPAKEGGGTGSRPSAVPGEEVVRSARRGLAKRARLQARKMWETFEQHNAAYVASHKVVVIEAFLGCSGVRALPGAQHLEPKEAKAAALAFKNIRHHMGQTRTSNTEGMRHCRRALLSTITSQDTQAL